MCSPTNKKTEINEKKIYFIDNYDYLLKKLFIFLDFAIITLIFLFLQEEKDHQNGNYVNC